MIRRLLFFFSFLLFSSYAFSVSFLPVPERNQSGMAAISYQLSNRLGHTGSSTFLSSEKISLDFDLNIAEADVGYKGRLYLLALYKNKIYMFTEQRRWLTWDGDPDTLQAFEVKLLTSHESVPVLTNNSLPAGEYLVIVGYQGRDGTISYNQSAVSFIVFDQGKNNNQLHRIEQAEFLKNYLNQAVISSGNGGYAYFADAGTAQFSGVAAEANSGTTAAKGVSETNIQESEVDESDRLKTDGNTLFVLQACNDLNGECLTSYQMQETPASVSLLGQIKLFTDTPDNRAQGEIFLYKNATTSQRSIISLNKISLNYGVSDAARSGFDRPYFWQRNSTELAFINATEAENMQPLARLSIEGTLISSKIVGETLYLVTQYSPSFGQPLPYEAQVDETAASDYMAQYPVDDFLPEITVDELQAMPLVKSTDCYITAQNSMRYYDASLINITAIPVNEPRKFKSTCIAGPVETVYVSIKAIYLASNRYPYELNGNAIIYHENTEYQTEIHKFSFADNSLLYRASGRIPGHLGWDADKRSFRMGEYDGILKVATSMGNTWDNTSRTRVAVLEEAADSQSLNEISHIDNLGKPGERLYAARFIGKRGFLVTFKVTDPLYVLDFTNPKVPAVIGELEISGYSDYLHPVSENLLLGIGKDAIADVISDGNADRGAWYQGVKVSLFDISNASRLKEIDSIVLGKRGSSSTALYNHHAVSWLDDPDTQSATLAIPVSLHNTSGRIGLNYLPGDPREYFDWTHTGLYVFHIDKNDPSLSLEGKLIADSNQGKLNYAPSIIDDRSVIQGGSVHYIHNNEILSSAINELK